MNNIATATATPTTRGMLMLTESVVLLLLLLLLLLIEVVVEMEKGVVSTYLLVVVSSITLQIQRMHLSMGLMETRGHRGGFSGVAHPHVL